MNADRYNIKEAVEVLENNLTETARVVEWARLMGFHNPKKFSRKFQRHYMVRPQKVLEYIRLKSIVQKLRTTEMSNFEIASAHGIPDEKALNKFTNYHLGYSPSRIKTLEKAVIFEKMEKLGSKIRE